MRDLFVKVFGAAIVGGALYYAVSGSSSSSSDSKTKDFKAGEKLPINGGDARMCGLVDLPAPAPGAGTGFDAMPSDFKNVYYEPMTLKPSDVTHLTQESAAMGAESFAVGAECAGYSEAAKQLIAKAAEIRSWVE